MTGQPLGQVTIGAREIYDQVVQMRATVDRLVDQGLDDERRAQDHEARLRALERGRWPLPTLTVLLSLAALVLAFLQAISQH